MPTDQPGAAEVAESAAAPKATKAKGADPRPERIAEIIRSHLRDSPLSREVAAWNFLQSTLGAIAEDILKEL
jgi:hypothetical protein